MKKVFILFLCVCCIIVLLITSVGLISKLLIRNNISNLLDAIEREDVSCVQAILEDGTDPNETNIAPSIIWTFLETSPKRPLTVACSTGNLDIVKLLIEYGATAEPQENLGYSPLRKTLFYYQPNDLEIVRLLLENGADADEIDGEKLVFLAAKMMPKKFDKNKTNGTVFKDGYDDETAKGITEIVKLLLDEQAVDSTSYGGKTLLMLAVQKENLCLVQYLLSIDCDIDIKDLSGKTAYDYAIQSGNRDIIALLEN